MKRGSFTQDVKEEICSSEITKELMPSLLAGFIKTNAKYGEDNIISLQTENSKIAKLIYQCFHSYFNVTPSFTYHKKMKLDKCVVYHINVKDPDYRIVKELQIFDGQESINPRELVLDNAGLRNYITGVFLASGTVNSPKSENYHLQLITQTENDAKFLIKCLNRFHNERNMDSKMIKRRNKYVVYIKKADQIANFLRVINASISLMEFENVRIQKDFLNSDNRYQICFNANYQKTIEKAKEQLEDISIIESLVGLQNLDEKQRIVAQVRKDNVDVPLSQISEIIEEEYNISLSKSSVNRIFSSIHSLALRIGGKK